MPPDETIPVAAPTPATEPAVTPVGAVEAPAAASEPVAQPSEPVAAPASGDPAATEAPAAEPDAEPAFKAHTETPTLLETAGKPEDKPGEKPAEPAAAAAPATAPEVRTYEPFVFPEQIHPEPAQVEAFTAIAAKHNLDQETAQSLVDMHLGAFKTFADSLLAEQHRVFGEMRAGWVDKIKADPELGGAGHQTAMRAVARMRDMLVPQQHQAEFDEFLRVTGAGDHPAFMRVLHQAARYFDEPAPPSVAPRPTADRGPGPRTFREAMYTHPTSPRSGATS
jgi:hypothetical protein